MVKVPLNPNQSVNLYSLLFQIFESETDHPVTHDVQ